MPVKRSPLLLTTGLLLVGTSVECSGADWACQQAPVTGSWSCDAFFEPSTEPSQAPMPAPLLSAPAPVAKPESSPESPPQGAFAPALDALPEETTAESVSVPAGEAVSERSAAPTPKDSSGPAPGPAPGAEPLPAAAPDPARGADRQRTGSPDRPLDLERLHAGLTWEYCGPPPADTRVPPSPPGPSPDEPIRIAADGFELYREEERAVLRGDVEVDRGSQHLETPLATYDRANGHIRAQGETLLEQPGIRLLSRALELDLDNRQAWAQHSAFRLTGTNARGTAESAHVETDDLSHYQDITYTACAPGDHSWELQADAMDLDRETGWGKAYHAKLRVAGIPLLYTPYINFPLDDRRKSGLLIPSVGYSDRLGFDLSVPYYLNLAPNRDATVTPRYLSKRGLMLGGEFRFLTADERGQFDGEWLPDDAGYESGGARGGFSFNQEGRFARRWSTRVDFDLVSDSSYLEDFGQGLGVTSTRHLQRQADVRYSGDGWWLLGRVQGFQTVDRDIAPEDRPYTRLPQLLFTLDRSLPLGPTLGLQMDDTWFRHSEKVQGNRLALRPSLALPLHRPYGHLIPRLTLNHVRYWLIDREPGLERNPDTTLATWSLDGQLEFERPVTWLGGRATQTLEPRLYYLYTPYQDQDDQPLFDTAELDFSFASLFRENRFSGRDRIGDANQLTLALTSRILRERDGRELFRANLGQILYFADRRVQTAGGPEDDSRSATAAELATRISDAWGASAFLLWDSNRDEEKMRKANLGLHYRDAGQRILNLDYRLNETDGNADTAFEDGDLSFRWPLTSGTRLVGRWLYSLRHDRTMEALGGIEYDSCCWRVRAVIREFVNSPAQTDSDLSFMLQFELSGLGTFGDDVPGVLERNIYGYEVE